jgi:hypothetical protein
LRLGGGDRRCRQQSAGEQKQIGDAADVHERVACLAWPTPCRPRHLAETAGRGRAALTKVGAPRRGLDKRAIRAGPVASAAVATYAQRRMQETSAKRARSAAKGLRKGVPDGRAWSGAGRSEALRSRTWRADHAPTGVAAPVLGQGTAQIQSVPLCRPKRLRASARSLSLNRRSTP